jgi:hypothetical protein
MELARCRADTSGNIRFIGPALFAIAFLGFYWVGVASVTPLITANKIVAMKYKPA